MELLLLVLLVLLVVAAIAVVICGEWLLGLVPIVKRIRRAHATWGNLPLKPALASPREIKHIVQRRFEEVGLSTDSNEWETIRHRRLGDIVALVSFKERELRGLIREMRIYSAFFLVLLLIGILLNIDDLAGTTLLERSEELLSHHTIPLLEAGMIVYLAIRLIAEAQSMRTLLEDPER